MHTKWNKDYCMHSYRQANGPGASARCPDLQPGKKAMGNDRIHLPCWRKGGSRRWGRRLWAGAWGGACRAATRCSGRTRTWVAPPPPHSAAGLVLPAQPWRLLAVSGPMRSLLCQHDAQLEMLWEEEGKMPIGFHCSSLVYCQMRRCLAIQRQRSGEKDSQNSISKVQERVC